MNKLLQKYIRIEPGFQKSVNLNFDLNDESKVADFIPSKASIEVIEKLFLGTHNSSVNRAHILIGAYGKGKSHIVLVLLSLLRDKNRELFERLLNSIKQYNVALYDFINEYLSDSTKKLLPVIIQGSNNSLTQSFLNAIQSSLKDTSLEKLMPDTHFQSAIKSINSWKSEFPETASKFAQLIEPEDIDSFLVRLMQYDSSAYETFNDIYPQLTSGATFNPFGGVDVVDIYTNVSKSIKEFGYNGIFVVYDEFSKYLESNIKDTSVSDIKMLQDFAEKCNRSKDNQLHLLLIAHKDIENYIEQLPKSRVDGWRGVSERFSHIEMSDNYGQIYEIMGQAIKKIPEFYETFGKEYDDLFTRLSLYSNKLSLFSELSDTQSKLMSKVCYPLHPLTAFILPRLSELVAQNERTLFTFISDSGKNSLPYLISHAELTKEFPVITADVIYDYFEPLFKKEIYTSDIYKLYTLVNSILFKVKDNLLQTKIVKVLALIYFVNQFERVEPISDIIIEAFDPNLRKEVIEAIDDLQNKKFVIYAKKSNGYLKLKTSSSSNVRQIFSQEYARVEAKTTLVSILQEFVEDTYFYPTKYNDDKSIIRYFSFKLISAEDVLDIKDWDIRLSSSNSDGVVFGVVPTCPEDISKVKNYLLNNEEINQRAVFILPKKYVNIEKIAYQYKAITNLISSSNDDDSLMAELNVIYEDLESVLSEFIFAFICPEQGKSYYINNCCKQRVFRKSHFANMLSSICLNVFKDTPIINNETVNKNSLPTNTQNSRNKVVNAILNPILETKLGLSPSSQEGSIARSLLVETGLIKNFSEQPYLVTDVQFNENDSHQKIFSLISTIKDFFLSCKGAEQSFSILYKKLTSPEFHIGLKKGVIPVFIAVVIHDIREQLTITSKGSELEITDKLLSTINEKPELYSARLECWTDEKIAYLTKLEDLFGAFINDRDSQNNSKYYAIAKAMQRWVISLPKYSKEMKVIYDGEKSVTDISQQDLQFISALKNISISPYDLLFIRLPEIYGKEFADVELVSRIEHCKKIFEISLDNLIKGLISDLTNIFGSNSTKGSSLSSIVKDWNESLADSTRTHIFDSYYSSVLSLISSISSDEFAFIKNIAKPVTGLRIEDWSYETVNLFVSSLKDFKDHIESYDKKDNSSSSNSNSYVLTTIDSNGNKQVKTFDKIECSSRAKLLKNEIKTALEEMGESISNSEKRQVLIEALESLS